MSRLSDASKHESELFRQSVGSVKPVNHDRAAIQRPQPAPVPTQRMRQERAVIEQLLSGDIDLSELETGDELLFGQPGVAPKMIKRLRKGHYSIRAELDLHGMTVPMARQALRRFLTERRAQGEHCVRIIHGKGHGSFNRQPVLKGKLDRWLRQRIEVLAFCSARPVDGGTGAIYVLLSRRSRNG